MVAVRRSRASRASKALAAVTGNLLPLSSHAITMGCDLLDNRETKRLRQEGCAKANALLNRYEELPQYDKGTLERSIEQQIAQHERHCAAKRERSAMRRKAFAKMKPVDVGDAPDTDSISSSSSSRRLAR